MWSEMATASESQVRAAEPLLASSLVDDEELDALFEGLNTKTKRKSDKIGIATGIKSVDDALDGAITGGRVVGISGEGGEVSERLVVN
jgi:predicted ATP-dependent serine protease